METTLATSCGKLIIRPTREEDAARLRELRLEALWMNPEAFASDHAQSVSQPLQWWAERADAGSGKGNQVTYVAQTADEQLVAMCGLYCEEGVKLRHAANLWGVYVRPAWRGLKISTAMINACETWARRRGIRLIRLSVTVGNSAAIHCYQRRGFVVYGTAPEVIHVNGSYHDELLMAKRLVPAATDRASGG